MSPISMARGLSVNIGQPAGGIVPNSVPEDARAAIDVRSSSSEGFTFFDSCLDDLLRRRKSKGMDLNVIVVEQVPIMQATAQNKALFNVVAGEANRLEIPVVEEFRAGVSDANTIAEAETPVVDGLGPVGRHDHSDRECLVRESLYSRSALLASSLLAAWRRKGRHLSSGMFRGEKLHRGTDLFSTLRILASLPGKNSRLRRSDSFPVGRAHPPDHRRIKKRVILSGDVPSPIAPPQDCRFHTRRLYAKEVCRDQEPPLGEVRKNHFAACFFNVIF